MSGQIAQAFAHLPEAETVAGISGHINRFWSRTKRRALRHCFDLASPHLHARIRKPWNDIRFPDA